MKTIIRTLAVALTLGVVATLASAASASDFGGYGGGNYGGGHIEYGTSWVPPVQHYPQPSYPQWNGNAQWSGKQYSGKQNFTPSQYSQPKKTKKGRFSQSVPYGY